MPGKSHKGPLPPANAQMTSLADELRQHVIYLAREISERNAITTPGRLRETADYIEQQFEDAGYAVRRQEYEGAGTICYNLEAQQLGKQHPEEIVVVGAHYDSVVDCLAANDKWQHILASVSAGSYHYGGANVGCLASNWPGSGDGR